MDYCSILYCPQSVQGKSTPGKVANLRDFRHRVAVLKRQGLIVGKTRRGISVDARYARPTTKVNGQNLGTIVSRYDDVASGKATAVKVKSRKQLSAFKKAGYETAKGRVIIPHSATETVRLERGEVVIKHRSGIERIQIPIPYHRLEQYLADIQKDHKRIDAMKRRNEYFGFKLFGNGSNQYSNIELLIEDLQNYQSVQNWGDLSRPKQNEIYRNLEIVKIKRNANWQFPGSTRRETKRKFRRQQSLKFRKRLKRKPLFIQEKYKEANRQRQREYRARIKRNRTFYKQYKDAAKKRAKRSRRNRKKK